MNVTGYESRHLYTLPEINGGPCVTLCGKEIYGGLGQWADSWTSEFAAGNWCITCSERFDLWKLGVTVLEGPDS